VYVARGSGRARAAFVARRTVGGAVARNRARRLLREAWRCLADRLKDGHDLVLMARAPIEGAKAHDVTTEIEDVLSRSGALR
jgi:ribonuclease P protein component